MRKVIGLAGVLVALICISMGCGKEELYTGWGKQSNESLSDSLSIQLGETAVAGNGDKLTFVKLLDDSRCPANAMCIWQGLVSVELKAETAAGEKTFTLTTDPESANAPVASVFGYDITLVNVLPYPGTTVEEVKPSDYQVALSIKKSAE